ncbi:hypothetical protein AgCh_025903 [Apium graveolens]
MSLALVLALPDFSKKFEIQMDASNGGIGAVLMQGGHHLSFLSKALGPKWQKLSVYEKELLAMDGHSGRDATLKRMKALFYWRGMSTMVSNFVRHCMAFQASKYENVASPGLLQPLSNPHEVWVDVSIDFILGLPKSQGKEVIMVVVDRLSKYVHFVTLSHPYSDIDVSQTYLDCVFRLHGWPMSIVSDRDPVFLSKFWQALFTIQGTNFLLLSSYHPQTDGQTEVVNKCLETFLRCMCSECPKDWSLWISLAEWWYNTNFHTSIQVTPYEIIYNQPPLLHLPYLPKETKVEVVDRSLQRKERMIKTLQFHLRRAQDRMKAQENQNRTERRFIVGDWVWLKLQPYRQKTMKIVTNEKLSSKYFDPFQVLEKVGSVAYKLMLPVSSQVHPVFRVSQIKAFRGYPEYEATLEPAVELELQFPDFIMES